MGKISRTIDNKNKSLALIYRYEFKEVFLPRPMCATQFPHRYEPHIQSDVVSWAKVR